MSGEQRTLSEQDFARAREIEERILFRLKEGLDSLGLAHINPAPKRLAEFIAIHLAEVREEGRQEGAVEAHRLWQSGALPTRAECAHGK
jgi:hypothetical protein